MNALQVGIGILLCFALAYATSRLDEKKQMWIITFFAILMPLLEVWKQITLTSYRGSYWWWHFPFQLCSMPLYLLPLRQILYYTQKKKNWIATIDDFLIDFGLLAGLFVFLDQSGMHYRLEALTIHSYFWHFSMIYIGFALLLSKRHSTKSFKPCMKLFLFLACIAEAINALCHDLGSINMFYISFWYPSTQVVFKDIETVLGIVPTALLYLATLLLGGYLFHRMAASITKALVRRSS